MHTTECQPCLKELDWWNRWSKSQTKADVSVVILEKYQTTYQSFLKGRDIKLPAVRDSAATLRSKNLIPTAPVKIYFNPKGKISLMYRMGEYGNIHQFIKEIEELNSAS